MTNFKAIVIGVSAGGLEALKTILPIFPHEMPVPVIIVQHLSADSDGILINLLNSVSKVEVKEAEDKELILRNKIYVAAPAYHILVEEDYTFSLSVDNVVNYARPSIDVLFESAAAVYQNNLIGVLLTGANEDGAQGLKVIQDNGGLVIVQDPKTAVAKVMPEAGIRLTATKHIMDLKKIGDFIVKKLGC